ncbi:hypothetical protein Pelo_17066 [Pelomyxa schiedti]|nr:hypothetical protein Pelo_17066 [Pelomyxa schiedti]
MHPTISVIHNMKDYLLRTPSYVPGSGILLDHHEFFHFKALSDVKNPQAEAFTLAHSNAHLITLCNAIRWLAVCHEHLGTCEPAQFLHLRDIEFQRFTLQ